MKKKKRPIGESLSKRSVREVKGIPPLNHPNPTGLMIRVHEALDVPIEKLEPEHVRVLVSQKFALDLVLPTAIEILDRNPWIDVDFYPGDLLEAVDGLSDEAKALCPGCSEKLTEIKSRPKPDDDDLWFPKET